MCNALLLKHYTTASVNNVVLCLHPHNSLEEKHHQFTPSSVFNPTLPSKKLHPANQEHEQLSPPHPPIHQARETQHQLQMLLNADDCGNPPTIIKTWVPVSNSLFGWFCHLRQAGKHGSVCQIMGPSPLGLSLNLGSSPKTSGDLNISCLLSLYKPVSCKSQNELDHAASSHPSKANKCLAILQTLGRTATDMLHNTFLIHLPSMTDIPDPHCLGALGRETGFSGFSDPGSRTHGHTGYMAAENGSNYCFTKWELTLSRTIKPKRKTPLYLPRLIN